MRHLFFLGAVCLALFELAAVYFILPLPGSQRLDSLELAYALYGWRWPLRGALILLLLAGLPAAWRQRGRFGWKIAGPLLVVAAASFAANGYLAADVMFRQPRTLILAPAQANRVADDRLVVGVERNGEAKAYPIQFIGYHHQVRDRVGGEEVLVTYCTVCRTGRVFSPLVEGRPQRFRLVGMDHWNAMFEDETTRSWWRQATGKAVAGPRKGMRLEEIPSLQVTLKQWLASRPTSLVMQADPAFADQYAKSDAYEKGTSRKKLTGTDTASWAEKSWVVGIEVGKRAKAYDWNRLKKETLVHDEVGGVPIVLVLLPDQASFLAFVRPSADTRFELLGDSLIGGGVRYSLLGQGPMAALEPVPASQEFWHSWRTFHPGTERY